MALGAMLNVRTLSTVTLPSNAKNVIQIVKHALIQLPTAYLASKIATFPCCQSLNVSAVATTGSPQLISCANHAKHHALHASHL